MARKASEQPDGHKKKDEPARIEHVLFEDSTGIAAALDIIANCDPDAAEEARAVDTGPPAGGSSAGGTPEPAARPAAYRHHSMTRLIGGLDRLVAAILSGGRWLLLPVVLFLFLQWPLRDFVQHYSREANDLGQWLFALYVAMAFTAATRAHTHLAADAVARHYSPRTRIWLAHLGAVFCLVPWALYLFIGGAKLVTNSLQQLEAFPDTYNPGYFMIKLALWVLAGLILAQCIIDIARPRDRSA